MENIFEPLRKALNARDESLHEISRQTGIHVGVLSRFATGNRDYISGEAAERLAAFLGAHVSIRAARRTRGKP